jgi:hypothetical protein
MKSTAFRILLAAAAAPMLALMCAAPAAHAQASARDVAALKKASLIYIATVRKDGNQSTPAPVWFTVTPDNQVLIQTSPKSWKAKRIRRGSPAIVWIGSKTGPAFIAKAQIVSDEAALKQIIDDYPRKYLMARVGFARPTAEKFKSGEIVAIRIAPVRDLADGFQSEPGTPAPPLEPKAAAAMP